MLRQSLLPVQRRAPGPVEAESQLADVVRVRVGVLRGHLNVKVVSALGVEECSGDIVDHDLVHLASKPQGRCPADEPERFQQRSVGEAGIIWARPKLFTDEPASNMWIVVVSFISVDPFCTYSCPAVVARCER